MVESILPHKSNLYVTKNSLLGSFLALFFTHFLKNSAHLLCFSNIFLTGKIGEINLPPFLDYALQRTAFIDFAKSGVAIIVSTAPRTIIEIGVKITEHS